MILTFKDSDEELSFEEETEVIRNVMIITEDANKNKNRYFLGYSPNFNSTNLFSFDVLINYTIIVSPYIFYIFVNK